MRPGERLNTIVFVCGTVCLAAAAGILIPLLGGSRLTDGTIAWTPPAAAPPSLTDAPERSTPRALTVPTQPATLTAAMPTAATLTAATLTASLRPPSPTVTVAASVIAPPTAAATPTVTVLSTQAPSTASLARILVGPANLRTGPGSTFPVIAQAQPGDTFPVTGRSNDGAWWQVCCVQEQRVWVAADLVAASEPTD